MDFPFTVSADAGTDIWKKPPSTNDFNAPYRAHSAAPLSRFASASVTFTAHYSKQFDQAGILLRFYKPGSGSSASGKDVDQATLKWIKAGVELFDGHARLSTVCCDNYADWSVTSAPDADAIAAGAAAVTILVERHDSPTGRGLWVYRVDSRGEKVPLREIAWVYADEGGEGWEVEVSAAAARPAKGPAGQLDAKFDNVSVKWD